GQERPPVQHRGRVAGVVELGLAGALVNVDEPGELRGVGRAGGVLSPSPHLPLSPSAPQRWQLWQCIGAFTCNRSFTSVPTSSRVRPAPGAQVRFVTSLTGGGPH